MQKALKRRLLPVISQYRYIMPGTAPAAAGSMYTFGSNGAIVTNAGMNDIAHTNKLVECHMSFSHVYIEAIGQFVQVGCIVGITLNNLVKPSE